MWIGNCYGNTALHEAARRGYSELLQILVNNHGNINTLNSKGGSILHFCCYGENETLETVKIVVKAGADLNQQDYHGNTPILICCSTGRLDILTYLVDNGADATITDNYGRNASDIATFYKHEKIINIFSQHKWLQIANCKFKNCR